MTDNAIDDQQSADIEQLMSDRLGEILATQPATERLILDSPPGAGKTGVVEHLAAQAVGLHGERVMIAGQTKNQAIDLASRINRNWDIPVYLLWSKRVPKPVELATTTVRIIHEIDIELLSPHVVIATADKWTWIKNVPAGHYALQIIEEAYQMRDAKWRLFAQLGTRYVLVGDPGQIDPVISVEAERWEDAQQPPHRSAPHNLAVRDPNTRRMQLPASRRVPGESAELVSELMYPGLGFVATSAYPERALNGIKTIGNTDVDNALAAIASGKSLVGLETHDRFGTMEDVLEAVIGSHLTDVDIAQDRPLTDSDTGIVCGPVVDVQSAAARCTTRGWVHTRAETADRWQGLERSFVIVMHPLWGEGDEGFALNAGRWSVMLSRHRIACLVIAPPQTEERLGLVNVLQAKRFGTPTSLEQGIIVHAHTVQRLAASGAWFATA